MVDAGDLLWKSATLTAARQPQQRIKAALQLEAYAHGGIDAMVPGEADLALGLDWLAAEMTRLDLPYVAANLSCEALQIPASRVVKRDGITLGFVGLVGAGLGGPCKVVPAIPALQAAIDSLGEVDLIVLLSHQDEDRDAGVVAKVSSIDVVVNGHGRQAMKPPRLLEGRAIGLSTGTRGKKLGIAQIELVAGGTGFVVAGAADKLNSKIEAAQTRIQRTEARVTAAKLPKSRDRARSRLQRLRKQLAALEAELVVANRSIGGHRHRVRNRLVPLNEDIVDHPHVHGLVAEAKPRIDAAAGSAKRAGPSPSPFVGDRVCLGCHAEQHAQWKSTPHAYAWPTLEKVGRSQDLDCWSCHVTGAHHPSGPQHPSHAEGLENVGCEACHGPGSRHMIAPARSNIRRNPGEDTCIQCHDGVKDEGRFDYPSYLRKVEH